jgi:ribosomal protein S17E
MESHRREPWSTTTDDWIGHIYKTTYSTKLCLLSDVRVEFSQEVGNVIDGYITETGMKKEESAKLKSTLLDAEKKLKRRLPFR